LTQEGERGQGEKKREARGRNVPGVGGPPQKMRNRDTAIRGK